MRPLGSGRIRVPPLPQFVVLIDRADGTEWVLSWADDAGTLRMSLNDAGLERNAPLGPRVDAVRGDYFDLGRGARVFVRGGRLGLEMVEYEALDSPLYTRVGVQRTIYEVVIPEGWAPELDEDGGPRNELGMVQENALD